MRHKEKQQREPPEKEVRQFEPCLFFSIGIRLFSKGERPIEIHNDCPGSLGSAGTAIRLRRPMNVFATLGQRSKHKEIPFDRLMAIVNYSAIE